MGRSYADCYGWIHRDKALSRRAATRRGARVASNVSYHDTQNYNYCISIEIPTARIHETVTMRLPTIFALFMRLQLVEIGVDVRRPRFTSTT